MFNVDETMRSLSVPMSVGHVTSLTDLREKRKAAEHAAMSAYSSMRAAKEHAARPVQYIEQPTPFYELERQPFSPSRTRSAEELHHLQRSTRELNTFTRICSTPPRDERALNARYAFQLAPEDQRYLHRKLSNGPTRAQRGYPPELDEAMLYGAAKPGHQDHEALVEASLQADPMDKNIAWTNAHFAAVRSAIGFIEPLHADEIPPQEPLAMTAALFSSFSPDGIFRPPKLPPVPLTARQRAERRERLAARTRPHGLSFAPLSPLPAGGGGGQSSGRTSRSRSPARSPALSPTAEEGGAGGAGGGGLFFTTSASRPITTSYSLGSLRMAERLAATPVPRGGTSSPCSRPRPLTGGFAVFSAAE